MKEEIQQAIRLLEDNGYKVIRPTKEVHDEYTFDNAWTLYQKKVGCKDKLRKKWNSMTKADRKAATEFIPSYVLSTPDKQFRKNFQTFLNQRGWEDELLGSTPPSAVTNEHTSTIGQLIRQADTTRQDATARLDDERRRILGLVRLVRNNPQSSARKSLEGYYNRGVLRQLNIDWQP